MSKRRKAASGRPTGSGGYRRANSARSYGLSLSGRSRSAIAASASKQLGELKGVDTDVTNDTITNVFTTNQNVYLLNGLNQGSSAFTRNGRKVIMRTLRLRGSIEFLVSQSRVSLTDTILRGNTCRMVVVYDRSPEDAMPSFNQVFAQTTGTGTTTTEFYSSLNYNETGRFRVLRDKIINFVPTAAPLEASDAAVGPNYLQMNHPFDEFIDLKMRETYYQGENDGTPTVGQINAGAIYVFFRAKYRDVAAGDPVVPTAVSQLNLRDFTSRLRYNDP